MQRGAFLIQWAQNHHVGPRWLIVGAQFMKGIRESMCFFFQGPLYYYIISPVNWQSWKITVLNRRYIFKWLVFHRHVSFRGCTNAHCQSRAVSRGCPKTPIPKTQQQWAGWLLHSTLATQTIKWFGAFCRMLLSEKNGACFVGQDDWEFYKPGTPSVLFF